MSDAFVTVAIYVCLVGTFGLGLLAGHLLSREGRR